MNLFVNEVFAQIFSFLTVDELVVSSRVNKLWNTITHIDLLWRRHCLALLDLQGPLRGSWRQTYKILHNWKINRYVVTNYKSARKLFLHHNFTILKDHSIYEVSQHSKHYHLYVIHNILTNKKIEIDFHNHLEQHTLKDVRVIATDIDNQLWAALDNQGFIRCFDVTTGQLEKKIKLEIDLEACPVQIKLNKKFLLIFFHSTFLIWDFLKNMLVNQTNVDGEILNCFSKGTFIFCHFVKDKQEKLHVIQAPHFSHLVDPKIILNSTQSSEVYIGLMLDKKLRVFALENGVNTFDGFKNKNIAILNNWLFVNMDSSFLVYNISNNSRIFELKHRFESLEFCVTDDVTRLLLSILNTEKNTYNYTLINFERAVMKIDLKKMHSSQKCILF